MRKGITSSVFILLFTFVSGSVFAGDKSECDHFKNNKDYKGAYGLCVAYQNADEAGQADILNQWMKRFGSDAPVLPNSPNDQTVPPSLPEVSCPCWDVESAVIWTQDLYAFSCENPSVSKYGEVIYSASPFFGDNSLVMIAGDTWVSAPGSSECVVLTQQGLQAMIPITESQAEACNAVLSGLILADEFIEDCLEQ